ncbi:DUF2157 domain-containing protein [Risungbinella massiliensis]|uniref:DUF2157 domain-containing protein n=1 Tax=Risungbinella massiliensis TaxID=1329796 RepID=UPI0005CC5040|nr:DUF2157 domain-containing protein [Risungbinella massiliensis]
MKRKVTKHLYQQLETEWLYLIEQGVLSAEQVESVRKEYEVQNSVSFLKIVLLVGAILVGAGILSFIAGNWSVISDWSKFFILLVSLIVFYLSGWYLESSYPRTSYSMYAIGLLIYGAGIFLIGQTFHLGSEAGTAFVAWAVGGVALALYLKDRWIFLFSTILMGIYTTYALWDDQYPLVLILYLPLLYWIHHKLELKSEAMVFFLNLLILYGISACIGLSSLDENWIPYVLFLLGLGMIFLPIPSYGKLLEWQGVMISGINGIILTFEYPWKVFVGQESQTLGLGFSILLLIFLIWMLRRGSLPSLLILAALIFRYYVDFSYDFLPKSLFFILGGTILILFGFWFEKSRKERKIQDGDSKTFTN